MRSCSPVFTLRPNAYGAPGTSTQPRPPMSNTSSISNKNCISMVVGEELRGRGELPLLAGCCRRLVLLQRKGAWVGLEEWLLFAFGVVR